MEDLTAIIIVAIIATFFTGCSVLPTHMTETQRQAIYASVDAAKAGRYDLADDYDAQIERIIPPPKKRIPITALSK